VINMRKAQTATEYLIILAVVIIITLIIAGLMGGIPSGSSQTSKELKLKMLCEAYKLQYVSYDYGQVTCQAVKVTPHYNLTQNIIINYDEGWLKNATNASIQDIATS